MVGRLGPLARQALKLPAEHAKQLPLAVEVQPVQRHGVVYGTDDGEARLRGGCGSAGDGADSAVEGVEDGDLFGSGCADGGVEDGEDVFVDAAGDEFLAAGFERLDVDDVARHCVGKFSLFFLGERILLN